MQGKPSIRQIHFHRRLFLFFLLAVAPGFVFLLQVVIFIPPAAILATVLAQAWQAIIGGQANELSFALFFFPHFLLFTLLYWLLASFFSRMISRTGKPALIWLLFSAVLFWVTQQSIYGAGGHGPGRYGPVQNYFLDPSWSFGTQYAYYFASLMIIGVVLGLRQRYKK